MKPGSTIGEIARTNCPRLPPSMPIRDAAAIFARMKAPAAAIIEESGSLVGLLTEKDCFRPMLAASYYQQWDGCVADYMTRDVRVMSEHLDLVSAAEQFLIRSHRVYPVMRASQMLGLLHRSDLLAAIIAHSEGGTGSKSRFRKF